MYDDYDNSSLQLINSVLQKLTNKHNADAKTTGIRNHQTGLLSLEVNGKPIEWFFNATELYYRFKELDEELD